MKRYLVIFFTVLFFPVLNIPMVHAQFSDAGVQELVVPMDAPDFTLQDLDGGNVSLKGMRGKIVILNFFTTW
jgi:cytochrome oxidase Cu insertion factor (SCO1/SenC/PrrC family)